MYIVAVCACTTVRLCIRTYTYKSFCLSTLTDICICVCVCIFVCVCICVFVFVCLHGCRFVLEGVSQYRCRPLTGVFAETFALSLSISYSLCATNHTMFTFPFSEILSQEIVLSCPQYLFSPYCQYSKVRVLVLSMNQNLRLLSCFSQFFESV